MPETQNTPWLARNAPFSHLGAPRGYQSVVVSVHLAKTRHSRRAPVWAENGAKTARTATEFALARPNFN
jgi:hypothetical protein